MENQSYENFLSSLINEESKARVFFKAKINLIIWIIFSYIYYILSNCKKYKGITKYCSTKLLKFSSPMDFITAFYFGAVTHSTVGYGDIYPIGTISRLFTWLHLIISSMIMISPDIRQVNINIFFTHILGILVFALIYKYSQKYGAKFENPNNKKELDNTEVIQLALSNQTTVGYGSIYPKNNLGRLINIVQIVYTVIILSSIS